MNTRIGIFTGRNEVLAKVMILHVSVILLTGGVPDPPGQTPPRQTSPPPGRHPPGRHPPGRHPLQADTPPPGRHHPPPGRHPPPGYGQRSAGTHPTGMHSCYLNVRTKIHIKQLKVFDLYSKIKIFYLPIILNGFMKPVIHKSAKAKLTTNMFPTFLKGCNK